MSTERQVGECKAIEREGGSKGRPSRAATRGKQKAGRLTVVNPLEGVVRRVQDPFSKVLHSLSPGQFLSKGGLSGA